MLRVCPEIENCPDDFVGNFSSEANDTLDFISRKFAPAPPKINNLWTKTACGTTFTSTISQADADQQAAALVALCTQNPCDGPCNDNPTFCNTAQTACTPCPDGTPSCFTVAAGAFCGYTNQASADSAALQFARIQSRALLICPSPLLKCTCVGSAYFSRISVGVPVDWTLVGGNLPPGLNFSDGFGLSTTISGTPTTSGEYFFQIRALSLEGNFALKTYSIVVLEIATTSLPAFTIGVPYSFQLQAVGGSGNYAWKITSGTLPNGLVMSQSGLISGTPT